MESNDDDETIIERFFLVISNESNEESLVRAWEILVIIWSYDDWELLRLEILFSLSLISAIFIIFCLDERRVWDNVFSLVVKLPNSDVLFKAKSAIDITTQIDIAIYAIFFI